MKSIKIAIFLLIFLDGINYLHASNESVVADLLEFQGAQIGIQKESNQVFLAHDNKRKHAEIDQLAVHRPIQVKKPYVTRTKKERQEDLLLCQSLGSNATTHDTQKVLFGREIREGRGGRLTPSALRIGLAYNDREADAKKKVKFSKIFSF